MTFHRRRTGKALLVLLSAFVLLAQLSAVSHAVWHAAQKASGEHPRLLAKVQKSQPHAPEISKLCVFDAAFGQVLGGAPLATHAAHFDSSARDLPVNVAYSVVSFERLEPHSRGPPTLL